MANYYTKGSFIIPSSSAQAEMVSEALSWIETESAEKGTELFKKNLAECTELEVLIRNIAERHPEFNHADPGILTACEFGSEEDEGEDYASNLTFEFAHSVESDGLWVFTDETLNIDHAICVTQAVLAVFDLTVQVGIAVAYSCSQPRTDGFGGAAFLVSKDFVRHCNVFDFLHMEDQAFKAQEAHYLVNVKRHEAAKCLVQQYVMNIKNSEDALSMLNTLLLGYARSKGSDEATIEESGYIHIWDESGIAAGEIRRLTPAEYYVMKNALPDVNNLAVA